MSTVWECWRVFPYDVDAAPGEAFSAQAVPSGQGAGRFDVPALTPVWYLAESPAHAVAEVLQGLRNQHIDAADLTRFGRSLALVSVTLRIADRDAHTDAFLDLCDPAVLGRHDIRPDVLASWDFSKTQSVAHRLFATACRAFRWWSALSGDWHTTVVFHEKLRRNALRFGSPTPLTLEHDAVREAARRLAMTIMG